MRNNLLEKCFSWLKAQIPLLKFVALSTLSYGILVVSLNYAHFPVGRFLDIFPVLAHWLLITLSSGIIIYLLALNRWVFTILYPIFTICTGIIGYYIFQYDITINTAVIESTFNTNNSEVMSQISLRLTLYVLLLATVSIWLVRKRRRIDQPQWAIGHLPFIILGFLLIGAINQIRFNTIYQRNPFCIYLGFKNYFAERTELKKERKDISEGAICHVDSLTMVVVIGEALRADHVSLNGYPRETFPYLAKEKVISFKNIYSEWTHTLKSIPHILTRADSANHAPSTDEHSFISIFKKCNFTAWWLGNQDLNKVFKPFALECDTFIINKPFKSDYNFTGKYDEELLPYLDSALSKPNPRKLIIFHQVGSHWYYPSYYPPSFEYFKPVLKSKSFNLSDKDKIINAYDNSARYTDYILWQIIERLRNQKAIMIYLSDHGELLGEEGKWIHAQDTKYEKNPACFVWFSDRYRMAYPDKVEAAESNKNKHFRSDFLFHSVLDAADITTPYRQDKLSILKK
ncbi:MAG TPA: sulfatase-like hydrolase/transferase [Bacteroidales bacterium]|nr:sulfatase-like hydrolase/transferase [Bacteroidales bacterium]HOK99073.1 sulfatase-like hydrolase/transferase [Bacteroidales bacterium]HPO66364.1 sulfatase-like hydrolase/transferase [Bacteroidales bacterium]